MNAWAITGKIPYGGGIAIVVADTEKEAIATVKLCSIRHEGDYSTHRWSGNEQLACQGEPPARVLRIEEWGE